MLVVGFIFTFLMVASLSEVQTLDPQLEQDIDSLLIDLQGEEGEDEYGKPRCMVDSDFEHDVYDHMRDPNIEFPPKKED